MRLTPPFRRALLFSGACAAFGAVAWAMIGFLQANTSEILPAACGGFISWGVIGFFVGFFSPPKGSEQNASALPEDSKPQRTVMRGLGVFIYRTIIGFLGGFVVNGLFQVTLVVLAMVTHGDVVAALNAAQKSQVGNLVLCAIYAGSLGALVCGVLFAWIWAVDEINKVVLASAFAGIVVSIGGIIPLSLTTGLKSFYTAILGGVVGGAIASVPAGFLFLRRPRTH
jgi:hypothetical protein